MNDRLSQAINKVACRCGVKTYSNEKLVTFKVAKPFDPASLAAALRVIHF